MLKKTELPPNESVKLNKLLKYFQKRWLNQIDSVELSTYDSDVTTNNGAESYHAKFKAIIKTAHPRIYTFVSILNDIIGDTNNESGKLQQCVAIECRYCKGAVYGTLRLSLVEFASFFEDIYSLPWPSDNFTTL